MDRDLARSLDDFRLPPLALAPKLLGLRILRDSPEGLVGGIISEVEAYDDDDPASHSYKGIRPRCRSMFAAPGTLYLYRIHQSTCLNLSCRETGRGAAVLIRAMVPTLGLDLIASRRAGKPLKDYANGPGKLCKALAASLEDDGLHLIDDPGPWSLQFGALIESSDILTTTRIGISKAIERPWRFVLSPAAQSRISASTAPPSG